MISFWISVVPPKHHRVIEVDPVLHQRGSRGSLTEHSATSQPSPEVIVGTVEAVPPKQAAESEMPSEISAVEAEPTRNAARISRDCPTPTAVMVQRLSTRLDGTSDLN
jgi:hypothetical protein